MSNDWDELFAMAEGAGDVEKEEQAPEGGEIMSSSSRSNRKKKSRKRKKPSSSRGYQEALNGMLKSRMTVPEESPVWPDWLIIGGAFASTSHCCSKFESSQEDGDGHVIPTLCCKNCQQSALHHTVHTTENYPCLHMFCNIRNLRAIAKILVLQPNAIEKSKQLSKTLQDQLNQLNRNVSSQSMIREIPAHESSLLESKVLATSKYANQVAAENSSRTNTSNNANSSTIDDLVRLMMACDDLYYRLYYLQITNQLSPMALSHDNNNDEGSTGFVFLPHPTDYFGLPHLVANHGMESQWCREFLTSLQDDEGGDGSLLEICFQRVGCPLVTDKKQDNEAEFHKVLHPLAAIRRFRFLETVSLFYKTGWYKSTDTHAKVVQSLNQGSGGDTDEENGEEETPAPSLLSEWRDSCRDFLCHLYAYATVPEECLTAMANFAKGGIVEYGAGTGYLAFCLATRHSVNVTAYDVCPTPKEGSATRDPSLNDYHGQTPCFSKVQKGDLATLSRDLEEHNLVALYKTLLLCYPPPKSSMAYDILKAFTEHGGKAFIHIGEFQGLTGDKNFEDYLIHKFECHERYPCYSWGTDAAEVTLWKRKPSKDSSPAEKRTLLLPCSFCGEREAVRRFRMLRYLVYCSKKCCKRDSVARRKHLLLQMVDIPDSTRIDFKDERQFSALP